MLNKSIKRLTIAGGMLIGFVVPIQANACCGCCACGPCVDAMLEVARAASDTAFEALGIAQDTLDQAIELGTQAEVMATNYYGESVVAALEAHAGAVTTELLRDSVAEEQLFEAYKESKERTARTKLVMEQAFKAATQYSLENIPVMAKILVSIQRAKVELRDNKNFDQRGETEVNLAYMMQKLTERRRYFAQKIISNERSKILDNQLDMKLVYNTDAIGSYSNPIVPEVKWPDHISASRFLVAPPSVQVGLSDYQVNYDDQTGAYRIANRVKAAADFMAWDLAIRSEIHTNQGSTSLLFFVKDMVATAFDNTSVIMDVGTADSRRELLHTIAINSSLENLLNMLILEANRYQLTFQAVELGFRNELSNNSFLSNNAFAHDAVIQTSVKKGEIQDGRQ